ncbi:MAG: alpha amylase C-terminal domain-containing protein [Bacteroidaceae bacterium]|nr:alpha amylase C-terminal domain-containing protein [Bacteroidaceae bacterium]
MLNLIARDSYLEPYTLEIDGRYRYFLQKEKELTKNGRQTLSDFASGYLYFGLHKTATGWCFREWAPNATRIVLVGDFSNWEERPEYELKALPGGVWERKFPKKALSHGQHYKMRVYWDGGCGDRIPAWTRRVVQDEATKIFCAQVWSPQEEYTFKNTKYKVNKNPLLIYECHIGMAQEEEKVGTYREFKDKILPRVAADGYNCIQIMAIQEHPYYGSFGYHVSNFFAPSSRFGTPEELKELIDAAHGMGIAVIMDLVHSHAVKNVDEGLGLLDGNPAQYFHDGGRRVHSAWDSLCFDYGKNEVIHFLLSNCKYWLEEYKFDGFRFDGVTSMIYYSHGLGEAFCGYGDYFNGHQDGDAICYLTLANRLIHQVNPTAITIAEEVSGMPGLAAPVEDGGYGFDYRMAMNIPDYWIKMIKEQRDEDWKPSSIFWELTNRRKDEMTISYAESHDQALVGDKTIIFRLIDADMYWHFKRGDETSTVTRGIALHKMIRLITLATINGGYLNFMGNEFGHPEWIDFPREGNGWSHKYARRQWSLVDNPDYFYTVLGEFDKEMTKLIGGAKNFQTRPVKEIWHNDGDQVLAFSRRDFIFVFNFNPTRSFTDYGLLVPEGDYSIVMSSDNEKFGGYGLVDESQVHFTQYDKLHARRKKGWLMLYLPSRTALVLKKNRKK